jgi:hypothetical protein
MQGTVKSNTNILVITTKQSQKQPQMQVPLFLKDSFKRDEVEVLFNVRVYSIWTFSGAKTD